MADDMKVSAERRTSFGKGAARKIRAQDKIPAVIYGHGTDPQHITLPGHQTMLLLRKANAVLELDVEGTDQLALVKDVQRDPVKQVIEHLDLIVVRRGEKVTVEVPVHLEGEPFPGTVAQLDSGTLEVETEATHIPERFVVDIEGAESGTQILAGEVKLPSGVTLLTDPEALVVGVNDAPAPEPEEEVEAEEAAEAEAEEAAEDEGESDDSDS